MAQVNVFAAGSLRSVLNDVAAAYSSLSSDKIIRRHGPAGLLRERIEAGDRADIFLSANLEHPARLAEIGRAGPATLFVSNELCALVREDSNVTSQTLASALLDPSINVGTSTPLKDPSGDYAWLLFHKIDAGQPGAFETLDSKAKKIVGGAEPHPSEVAYNVVIEALLASRIDIFLGYRTGAQALADQFPNQLRIVEIPSQLCVKANYGFTILRDASPEAYRFAHFLMSIPCQTIFQAHGFRAIALPACAAPRV